jgi:SsrA-binding protein
MTPTEHSNRPERPNASGTIAENRRARFDYEITQTYEAGIELHGYEVKGAKAGAMQVAGTHVLIRGGEAWLVNAHIPAFQPKNTPVDYEDDRARRLLLSRAELIELSDILKSKSAHVIPLRAYLKRGLIKIELGIGRSRKKSDKREVLKKRSHLREMRER